jgi:creatinine amidohydrolase
MPRMRTLTMLSLLACVALPVVLPAVAQAEKLATREMNDLNWMEFKKLVPARVDTVLVTVGTMEPHGVINNGADNTAPVAIARALADEVNALVAPNIPYGVTGDMAPYPGALHVPEDVFRNYVHAVLDGMAKNGFRRIVVINGHGGPQTAVLQGLLREVAFEHGVQTLLVNWWSLCTDETIAVFGEDGGHAGNNETAFIQAINPKLVHKEMYSGKEMATANPAPGAWSATPFPSTITLYKPGQGYPKDFDQKKADEYYKKVVNKVGALIKDTIKKWNLAGFR